MNKQDLDNLIRWAVDTDGIKFAKEIYGRSGNYDDENSTDEYTIGKFLETCLGVDWNSISESAYNLCKARHTSAIRAQTMIRSLL